MSLQIEHDEPVERRAAGAYTGDDHKRFGAGNSYADMAEAVGDAFAVEDVTAVD